MIEHLIILKNHECSVRPPILSKAVGIEEYIEMIWEQQCFGYQSINKSINQSINK